MFSEILVLVICFLTSFFLKACGYPTNICGFGDARTLKPLNWCSNVRVVFNIIWQTQYLSAKLYITHDLVSLLQLRGLYIPDALKAEHYLKHIGYYRLSAYMHPIAWDTKEHHLYKQGATFSKVMMLYRFDKKLRLLLFNELEKIEVAVRSAIVNIGSFITGNPFWMTDSANFVNWLSFIKQWT